MQRSELRITLLLVLTLALAALPAAAQPVETFKVTVTNLTFGQVISPPLAVSHSRDFALWHVGEPASPELVGIAEDALYGPMMAYLPTVAAVEDFDRAAAPLPPGHSVTLMVDAAYPFNEISVVGMLVTTNDAFFGVHAPQLPFKRMTDVYFGNAYDAGSEVNNEDCAFVPGPPCENVGVRDPDGAEGFVHIHRGIFGIGDLVPEVRDWRNPVAKVTIQAVR